MHTLCVQACKWTNIYIPIYMYYIFFIPIIRVCLTGWRGLNSIVFFSYLTSTCYTWCWCVFKRCLPLCFWNVVPLRSVSVALIPFQTGDFAVNIVHLTMASVPFDFSSLANLCMLWLKHYHYMGACCLLDVVLIAASTINVSSCLFAMRTAEGGYVFSLFWTPHHLLWSTFTLANRHISQLSLYWNCDVDMSIYSLTVLKLDCVSWEQLRATNLYYPICHSIDTKYYVACVWVCVILCKFFC